MKTIFEKIIAREIPAYIVYEDDLVISFLDITQATAGHTLVATKKPYKDLLEIEPDVLSHLILVTQKIAKAVYTVFQADGINLLNNNGETAGQTVFHYHMHILPRHKNDEVLLKLANHMQQTSADDFKKRAELIKSAL